MAAELFRDAYGIPHLRADSVDDLARIQGQNAAQDRAWQLDWNRRRAEGRTAEIVGEPGLIFDRFARKARVDETARRCFEGLDEQTRTWCTAYVDGVNAGLAAGAHGVHEFDSLDVEPGRWQPWTPLSVFAVQQLLFGGFPYKLWRRHVSQRLGAGVSELLDTEIPDSIGSNAWGVRGHRTASGLPIIAGDPHRGTDFPGVYQQVRLACPEFDVVGFTFPGVPGVQHFAHAGEVAWAITNAMADYQDLFIEELRREDDRVSARGQQGWEPVTSIQELITVRDGAPESVEILITDRGPVIIDEAELTISLRTPTYADNGLGFAALLPLLRARSVDDVEAALRQWVEPVNSCVVADRSGELRHLVPGRVPIRDAAHLDGPVPAWDAKYAWTGDYAPMPVMIIDDLVTSANDRATGGGLGKFYAAGWRAGRITARLRHDTAAGGANVDTMASIHGDVWLGPARLAKELLAGVDVDGPAKLIKDEILDWDGSMDAGSRGAMVYAAWRAELAGWIADQEPFIRLREPEPLPQVYANWMNVRNRIGVSFDAICRNAADLGLDLPTGVSTALQTVADEPPPGVWGDAHRLAPIHGLLGLADDHLPPMPEPRLSGDSTCVMATHSSPGITHRCTMASMARYVWDLADRQASGWVVPYGASGIPGDPHHADQTEQWAAGKLVPVVTDWDKLIKVEPAE
jgi:penicillin amidase